MIYKSLIISFNGSVMFMAEIVGNKWEYMRISMFNCLGNGSLVENILVGWNKLVH